MSGDVDSDFGYSAVVKNVGVAVEISLLARSVPNCHPLSVLVSAIFKILKIKICQDTTFLHLPRAFQRAITCPQLPSSS